MEIAMPLKPNFLITYDLIDKKDYRRLIKELEAWGCRRDLLSAWFLSHEKAQGKTAQQLVDHFCLYIDADDELLIIGICDYAPWFNAEKRKARLKPS